MASTLRCPYCHDAVEEDALDRVSCMACGAVHHRECFLEQGGCAATACGRDVARVGVVEVSLEALRHLGPEDLAALARRRAPRRGLLSALLLGLLMAGTLTISGLVVGAVTGDEVRGAVAGFLFGAVLALLLIRARDNEQRPRLWLPSPEEDMGSFDPILGIWRKDGMIGLIPSNPLGPLADRLRAGAPPRAARAASAGPTPATCPCCGGRLLEEGEAPDEPTPFCFHCGADLARVAAGRAQAAEVGDPHLVRVLQDRTGCQEEAEEARAGSPSEPERS